MKRRYFMVMIQGRVAAEDVEHVFDQLAGYFGTLAVDQEPEEIWTPESMVEIYLDSDEDSEEELIN